MQRQAVNDRQSLRRRGVKATRAHGGTGGQAGPAPPLRLLSSAPHALQLRSQPDAHRQPLHRQAGPLQRMCDDQVCTTEEEAAAAADAACIGSAAIQAPRRACRVLPTLPTLPVPPGQEQLNRRRVSGGEAGRRRCRRAYRTGRGCSSSRPCIPRSPACGREGEPAQGSGPASLQGDHQPAALRPTHRSSTSSGYSWSSPPGGMAPRCSCTQTGPPERWAGRA